MLLKISYNSYFQCLVQNIRNLNIRSVFQKKSHRKVYSGAWYSARVNKVPCRFSNYCPYAI